MLKKILVAVAAFAGLVVLVGFWLPRTAHVERSIVIEAPQSTVFTVLNGFRQFHQWSPWADLDPGMQSTIEGPVTGVGAKLSWTGNDEVGTGSQEILESTPHSAIRMRLTFGDFPGDYFATFDLRPESGGTLVTWAFEADYGGSLMGRYFGLLSDRMVGPDYEKGLARLKALIEKLPKGDFAALKFDAVETAAEPLVLTSIRSADHPRAIGVALGVAYGRISGYLSTTGLKQAAAPIASFRPAGDGTVAIEAGIPVDRPAGGPTGEVRPGQLPAGRAVRAEYQGPYTGLADARRQLKAYLAATGLEAAGEPWEQYVSDPATTPDAQLVTYLYAPVK